MESTTRPWAAQLLVWLLGAWFALGAFTGYLAGTNFAVLKPERLERSADFYGDIPEAKRETSLRYAASELNRHYFTVSYTAQLAFAVMAGLLAFIAGRPGRVLIGALLAALLISLFLTLWLTPEIVELGRTIDDVPREPITPDREAFNQLHRVAVGVDGTKLLVLLVAGGVLTWRRKLS